MDKENIKSENNKIVNDYNRIYEFAKKLSRQQLDELQGIFIESELNPKCLEIAVNAFFDAFVEKNKNIENTEKMQIYDYKDVKYEIPVGLLNTIYEDQKNSNQIEFLKELKNSGIESYSYLESLDEKSLEHFAVESKDLEERYAIKDNIPEEAVLQTIDKFKKRELLNNNKGGR